MLRRRFSKQKRSKTILHSSRIPGIDPRNVFALLAALYLFSCLFYYTERKTRICSENSSGSEPRHDHGYEIDRKVTTRNDSVPTSLKFFPLQIKPPPLSRRDMDLLWRGNLGETRNLTRTIINPAVATVDGDTYMVAREHEKIEGHNWWSNVIVGRLDGSHGPASAPVLGKRFSYLRTGLSLPSAVERCFLKQKGHFISGPSDPRLFVFRNSVWASFSFYSSKQPYNWQSWCSDLEYYTGSVWIQDISNGGRAVELWTEFPTNTVEKNWVFFSHRDSYDVESLYAVYSVEPHVILHVNPVTGQCDEVSRTSFTQLFGHIPENVRTHLGATPARFSWKNAIDLSQPGSTNHLQILKTMYSLQLGMFHTKEPNYLYKHYFYVYADSPPFDVMCVSSTPVSPPRDSNVSFETTVELLSSDKRTVAVWYGIDDLTSGVSYYRLIDILYSMVCQSVAPNPVAHMENRVMRLGWSSGLHLEGTGVSKFSRKLPNLQRVRWEAWFRHSEGLFNPSILSLPCGSKYPYIGVARTQLVDAERTEKYSGKIWPVHHSKLVGCVLDYSFTCVGSKQVFDLPVPNDAVDLRLFRRSSDATGFNYDVYLGAEDGRLAWDPSTWQVFLLYVMNSEIQTKLSRNLWIVDLEVLYPFLKKVIALPPEDALVAEKRFLSPTEMVFPGSNSPVEKNWIPFLYKNRVLINYSLYPHVTFEVANSGLATKFTEYNSSESFKDIDHVNFRINQGSGSITVRLCKKSRCNSSTPERNVAIFHTRDRRVMEFKHFVVIFETRKPFSIERVYDLKQLESAWYRDANISSFAYVVSLDYVREACNAQESNAANLDSIVIIGFGSDDTNSYVYSMRMSEFLSRYISDTELSQGHHTGCST